MSSTPLLISGLFTALFLNISIAATKLDPVTGEPLTESVVTGAKKIQKAVEKIVPTVNSATTAATDVKTTVKEATKQESSPVAVKEAAKVQTPTSDVKISSTTQAKGPKRAATASATMVEKSAVTPSPVLLDAKAPKSSVTVEQKTASASKTLATSGGVGKEKLGRGQLGLRPQDLGSGTVLDAARAITIDGVQYQVMAPKVVVSTDGSTRNIVELRDTRTGQARYAEEAFQITLRDPSSAAALGSEHPAVKLGDVSGNAVVAGVAASSIAGALKALQRDSRVERVGLLPLQTTFTRMP